MNTARSTASLNREEATVNRNYDYILYDYLDWIKIRKQVNKELRSKLRKICVRSGCGKAAQSTKPSSPKQASEDSGSPNKLQPRIAKAVKNNKHRLRKRLSYLLIKSYYAHLISVKKVSENKGGKTTGIDGEIWSTSKAKMKAVSLLKTKKYKSKPLKRIYIEKKGKKKKRPLSIPCMIDRAVQALYALSLEPVSEITGDLHSYGFRKYRSTKDACSYIKLCLQQKTSAQQT